MGDLPESYDAMKEEAYQVTMAPRTEMPNFMVCKYQEMKGVFEQEKIAKNFH